MQQDGSRTLHTGPKAGCAGALWHNDLVGGQRPVRLWHGGLPVLSDSGSDVLQNITAPSLERRIMKKLNKVASLFATAALATSMSGAFAQTTDNWVNGSGNLPWKNGTNELCWRDCSRTPATANGR